MVSEMQSWKNYDMVVDLRGDADGLDREAEHGEACEYEDGCGGQDGSAESINALNETKRRRRNPPVRCFPYVAVDRDDWNRTPISLCCE
jgi:hypothetical protein